MAILMLENFEGITKDKLLKFIDVEFYEDNKITENKYIFLKKILKENLIDIAFTVAKKEHEGQKRKSGSPYIVHPEAVADLAAIYGLYDELIIIAFLHDTYEDSKDKDETEQNIDLTFGTKIKELVKSMAHDKLKSSYTDYVKNLLLNSETKDLFLVKLCDMLHNLSDGKVNPNKYISALKYLIHNEKTKEIVYDYKIRYPELFDAVIISLKLNRDI